MTDITIEVEVPRLTLYRSSTESFTRQQILDLIDQELASQTSPTGGITQQQAKALIRSDTKAPAQTGNTARWTRNDLPTDVAYDEDLPDVSGFARSTDLPAANRLIPDGGTSGQVLKKDSGTDYDVSWQDDEAGTSTTGPEKATNADVDGETEDTKYITVAKVFRAIARKVKDASTTVKGIVLLARNEDVDDSETDLTRVLDVNHGIRLTRRQIKENVRSIPEATNSHIGRPLVATRSTNPWVSYERLGTDGIDDNSVTTAKLDSTARSQLVPSGGTSGQVLKKDSNTNYDVSWQDDEAGTGGGGGLTENQVKALIADPAETGNTSRWSKNKVPSDTVYDADIANFATDSELAAVKSTADAANTRSNDNTREIRTARAEIQTNVTAINAAKAIADQNAEDLDELIDLEMIPGGFPADETQIQRAFYLQFVLRLNQFSAARLLEVYVQGERVLRTGFTPWTASNRPQDARRLIQFSINAAGARNLKNADVLDEGDSLAVELRLLEAGQSPPIVFSRTIQVPVLPRESHVIDTAARAAAATADGKATNAASAASAANTAATNAQTTADSKLTQTQVDARIAAVAGPNQYIDTITAYDATQNRFEDSSGNEVVVPNGANVFLTQAVYDAAVADTDFTPNQTAVFFTR